MYKLLFLILFLFASISIDRGGNAANDVFYDIVIEQIDSENALTLKNILAEMIDQKLKHIDILMAQIKVETGSLKYVYNNNLFGFRHNKYMHFTTWQDCVSYMKKWQDKKYKGGNYFDFLKDVKYAENPEYIEILKTHIKKY